MLLVVLLLAPFGVRPCSPKGGSMLAGDLKLLLRWMNPLQVHQAYSSRPGEIPKNHNGGEGNRALRLVQVLAKYGCGSKKRYQNGIDETDETKD